MVFCHAGHTGQLIKKPSRSLPRPTLSPSAVIVEQTEAASSSAHVPHLMSPGSLHQRCPHMHPGNTRKEMMNHSDINSPSSASYANDANEDSNRMQGTICKTCNPAKHCCSSLPRRGSNNKAHFERFNMRCLHAASC